MITNPVFSSYNSSLDILVSQENLKAHTQFLSTINPPRSYKNTESLVRCADYIARNFSDFGFKVSRQHYNDGGHSFQNIIAKYNPEKKERVILGAHYDVCGNFAGADDNASGVAGMIEIARLVAENQPVLEYGIDFVAYSTEEPPYFGTELMGSAVHADSVIKESLKMMIVLEMIGYYSSEANSQTYPIEALKYFYPSTADFIAIVGRTAEFSEVRRFKKNMISSCMTEVKSINTPVVFVGIDFSDHRNYWNRDMKAIMITNTAFYRNKNYHTANDTPETLDFDKMTEVVKGAYHGLINIQ